MNYDLSADGGLVHYTEKFNKHYKLGFHHFEIGNVLLTYYRKLKARSWWIASKVLNNGKNKYVIQSSIVKSECALSNMGWCKAEECRKVSLLQVCCILYAKTSTARDSWYIVSGLFEMAPYNGFIKWKTLKMFVLRSHTNGRLKWRIWYGPYHMDHIIWTISYGSISYGPYHMKHIQ